MDPVFDILMWVVRKAGVREWLQWGRRDQGVHHIKMWIHWLGDREGEAGLLEILYVWSLLCYWQGPNTHQYNYRGNFAVLERSSHLAILALSGWKIKINCIQFSPVPCVVDCDVFEYSDASYVYFSWFVVVLSDVVFIEYNCLLQVPPTGFGATAEG